MSHTKSDATDMIDGTTARGHLAPIHKAEHQIGRVPDQSGQDWGIAYAGWGTRPPMGSPYLKVYAISVESGDLIKRRQLTRYRMWRTWDYHALDLDADVQAFVRRLYWRRVYSGDRIRPLDRVQHRLQEEQEEKAERRKMDLEARKARRSNRRAETWVVGEDAKPIRV